MTKRTLLVTCSLDHLGMALSLLPGKVRIQGRGDFVLHSHRQIRCGQRVVLLRCSCLCRQMAREERRSVIPATKEGRVVANGSDVVDVTSEDECGDVQPSWMLEGKESGGFLCRDAGCGRLQGAGQGCRLMQAVNEWRKRLGRGTEFKLMTRYSRATPR